MRPDFYNIATANELQPWTAIAGLSGGSRWPRSADCCSLEDRSELHPSGPASCLSSCSGKRIFVGVKAEKRKLP